MKRILLTILAITLCISVFSGCNKEEKRNLTIDELKIIAEKGENMSMSDFEKFNCISMGSGIPTTVFPIEGGYQLTIMGKDSIEVIRLSTVVTEGGNIDDYREIDIRTESIDEFIKGQK